MLLLAGLLLAPFAWAGQPWESSELGWIAPAPQPAPPGARSGHAPERLAVIQADGNHVPPRLPLREEQTLLDAVRASDVETVRTLLKRGINPNAQDAGRDSALLLAVRQDHPELVQVLLDAGAYVDVRGRGFTPLGLAVRQGSLLLVRMLLRAGADPDIRNVDGDTALHSAVRLKRIDIASALARVRPGFGLFDREGLTPLALAVTTAQGGMVEMLVGAGAPIESGNRYLHSPLWLASAYNDQDMVRLLLKLGADPGRLTAESSR